ncbi:hypothetical protein [Caulobacter sp. 17J80-11]|uniref:hypothetical protein n=1 Tax=Caulobacter sp. 17J80-11 TaxID=2763502 RepID=UPI0016538A2C|nr:hypothetical protein [Caulobacter sp. 17J80-11]MBC6982717.1 hypothetical protein [Caulobacter sp. 17J80-11]
MHDFPSWASTLRDLSTGLAAAIAGWVGLRGVGAWRAEAVGRRKTELAEEVLAQFYRARDALTWARFPHPDVFADAPGAGEGADDDAEARRRQAASAPVERLSREMALFSDLQANRYRFMAVFGEAAARPFDEIMAARDDVVRCARDLMRSYADDAPTPEAAQARGQMERDVGWGARDTDPIAARVDAAIHEIERTCRPLIDEVHRKDRIARKRG